MVHYVFSLKSKVDFITKFKKSNQGAEGKGTVSTKGTLGYSKVTTLLESDTGV